MCAPRHHPDVISFRRSSYYLFSPYKTLVQVNAKHVDQVINDLAVVSEWEGHASHGTISPPAPPPPPMLPWWFTTECQSQLESVEPSAEMAMPPPSIAETIVANAGPEQVRAQLRNQLEYYFSRLAIPFIYSRNRITGRAPEPRKCGQLSGAASYAVLKQCKRVIWESRERGL